MFILNYIYTQVPINKILLMSAELRRDYNPISNTRLASAFFLTLTFCGTPLLIYINKTLFRRFCDFHKRKFKLDQKNPYQIASLSFGLSIVYTSVYCPFYYYLFIKILGISGVSDLTDRIKKSSKNTFRKYPAMRRIDQKLVHEVDKYFGIEDKQTQEFLDSKLGKGFDDWKTKKQND